MKGNNKKILENARGEDKTFILKRNSLLADEQKRLESELGIINTEIRMFGKIIAEGNDTEVIDDKFKKITAKREELAKQLKFVKEERRKLKDTFKKIGVGILGVVFSATTIATASEIIDANTQNNINNISNSYSQSHEAGYDINYKNVSTQDILNLLKMQLANKIIEITGETNINANDIKIEDNSFTVSTSDPQALFELRGKTVTDITVSVKGRTMFKYKSSSSIAGGNTTYEKDNNMPEDMLRIIKLIVSEQKRGENNRTTATERAIIRKISNLGNKEDNKKILEDGVIAAYGKFKAEQEQGR